MYRQQPRARGQTVWETPRGVGLTPKTPGVRTGTAPLSAIGYHGANSDDGDDTGPGCPSSASSAYHRQQPRVRGQTVWETPRGVGLTPRTAPAAAAAAAAAAASEADRALCSSGEAKDRNGGGGYTGVGVEECKGETPDAAGREPGGYKQPRARGQTVWETPRGVGLTPKTTGAATASAARRLPDGREGCSPAAWSAASSEGSSKASPGVGVVDGQSGMRSYAQGGL